MNVITTKLTTEAIFSDDGSKRYLLRKTWDEKKRKLAILMLSASAVSGVEIDYSCMLVLNNASRLDFGSVDILNISATLDDHTLSKAEVNDSKNLDVIVKSAENADVIVYAAGVGKAKSKVFQELQHSALEKLRPFEAKLHCLCNSSGSARLQHPLSPAVKTWHLSPFKVGELIDEAPQTNAESKKKPKSK